MTELTINFVRLAPVLDPALEPGWSYGPPVGAAAIRCKCNLTYYNLISACAVCQFGKAIPSVIFLRRCVDGGLMATS